MSLFSDNIRHLRIKKEVSQQYVADNLYISRDRLAKYEEGKSQPPFEILIKLSHYYHVSIDLLLTADIRKVDIDGLLKLDDNRILLPIVVDTKGGNIIEIIPHKAKAGYLNGYSDPEFVESLQHISLPFLGNGKFRTFPVEGDSMPPHKDGSFIVGRYVENEQDVKEGRTYVLLTKNEGIVYKRLKRIDKRNFMLISDNSFYEPYPVPISEILEIWEYAGSIATKEFEPDNLEPQSIRELLYGIREEVKALKHIK
ncbi:LexA family transcriptional regulator [Flavobacterium tructae]|uniref:XRE family transcriptional regulator n=1 Tax=Flavobacterium tructae TaxID=1114873 RepID=UPI002551FCAB|nr:LexA family transcriptional regulator [Flavobacterium tructae]MDL2141708.1 LexA family transcriptional regulator [Flavobacterium tructae]